MENQKVKVDLMPLDHCPVCRQQARRALFKIKHSEVFECGVCHLRYLDPCLSPESMASTYESEETLQEFHSFHEGYYDYGDLQQDSRTRRDFEHGLAILEKGLAARPDKAIFDVGYGNGFFLALAGQRGWRTGGIDTSPENQKLAQKKFGLDLGCGRFERDAPSAAVYDAVTFWDVVEHLPDPYQAITRAKAMLRPGGHVLVALPHDKSLLMVLATALYRLSLGKIRGPLDKVYMLEHVAYYHLGPLKKLFHANGFELADYFYTRTDLAKYKLSRREKMIAACILAGGKVLGCQNRIVTVFRAI
ncbi:MAG: class I SAM-dependent methyltransferase [Candidatus Omnitrophica bacterium]|nr:class I SAM-dependent methyltransferase [Candidatus Omnitrophota bacterium]MDD5671161.1 class I SAM-dependent methyltransferase [Candidatus Omnitrophota bacterium]